MKSDLYRFITFCSIIFLMLILLKSCPSQPTSVVEPEIEIVKTEPVETTKHIIKKQKPEYLARTKVFLNDSLAFVSTQNQMIYSLGKPDTVKSTDQFFYYQYSSFSRNEDIITWKYIDFRTMRFVWTTPYGDFNFSSTFEHFKTQFPESSKEIFQGKDKLTGEPISYIKIPESPESKAFWTISFSNGKLRSTELNK